MIYLYHPRHTAYALKTAEQCARHFLISYPQPTPGVGKVSAAIRLDREVVAEGQCLGEQGGSDFRP